MPFDADLAARVRDRLARRRDVVEKRMFGGLAFLLDGNVLVCVMNDTLIVRLGPDGDAALLEPHVRVFDFTGKAMSGWVVVEPEGLAEDDQLADWIDRTLAFVETLPPK